MNRIRKGYLTTFSLSLALSSLILGGCRPSGLKKIDVSHSLWIESEALIETREIFIHLPEGYDLSDSNYPVLYVLDAEDVFGFAVGAVDFLAPSRMPEMIVVGIPNTNRERDIWVDPGDPDGGYVRFIQFLEKELIPTIDVRFRTLPFRILYGFCSGASTVFWLLFSNPEMFTGYIASGTGFDETWADLAAQAFAKQPELKKSLFAVTEGATPRAQGMALLHGLLESSAPPGLRWDILVMEGEEHGPVLARGLFAGLRFVFSEWRLPEDIAAEGPAAVRKYYKELSRNYGFDTGLPSPSILSVASSLLWRGERPEAIEILRFMTETQPDSPDAFVLLGTAYQEDNRHEQAKDVFETAVRVAKRNSDRRLPAYEEMLGNVTEQIRASNGRVGDDRSVR